jgi:hypothetical protein
MENKNQFKYFILTYYVLLSMQCSAVFETFFAHTNGCNMIICIGERHVASYTLNDLEGQTEERDKKVLLSLLMKYRVMGDLPVLLWN